MNCYVCDEKGVMTPAVAICHNCSVALCRAHLDADLTAPRPAGLVVAHDCTHHPRRRAAARRAG